MSITRTVLVQKVEKRSGTSQSGKTWTRYDVTDGNGQTISTFNAAIGESAISFHGKRAELDVSTKEKNGRVDELLDAIRPAPLEPEKPAGSGWRRDPGEARLIVRQTALKAAVQFLGPGTVDDVPVVKAVAEEFVELIYDEPAGQPEPGPDDDVPF